MTWKMDRTALIAMLAALCAVMAARPAPAQEGAPAAGDAPQAADSPAAAPANRDVEPFTPQRGPAGLQRRANLKALITIAHGNIAGLPAANVRTAPPLGLPRIGAVPQRNAIGVVLPGAPSSGHGVAGIAAPAGSRPASIGTSAANVTGVTHQTAAVPNAGQAPRGAALNGTTMGRMSPSPGFIGGPAKNHSGIDGTSMSPKH